MKSMNEVKKSKTNLAGIIVIVLVVLFVGVGAAVYFARNDDANELQVNSTQNNAVSADYAGYTDTTSRDGKLTFKRPNDWKSLEENNSSNDGFGPAACSFYSPTNRPCLDVKFSTSKIDYTSEYFSSTLKQVVSDTKQMGDYSVTRYISSQSDTSYPVRTVYQYVFQVDGGYVEFYGEDTNAQISDSLEQTFEKIVASVKVR